MLLCMEGQRELTGNHRLSKRFELSGWLNDKYTQLLLN